jgi:hypothetical protein
LDELVRMRSWLVVPLSLVEVNQSLI